MFDLKIARFLENNFPVSLPNTKNVSKIVFKIVHAEHAFDPQDYSYILPNFSKILT